mgnify:CR=1 FL=1
MNPLNPELIGLLAGGAACVPVQVLLRRANCRPTRWGEAALVAAFLTIGHLVSVGLSVGTRRVEGTEVVLAALFLILAVVGIRRK